MRKNTCPIFFICLFLITNCSSPTDFSLGSDSPEFNSLYNESSLIFAGGNGSIDFPYEVKNIKQLQAIGNMENLGKHFIQIADINGGDTEFWNGGKGFKPIGNEETGFTGTYDGGGYKISGLAIYRENENYVGMFGATYDARIQNTNLENLTVKGKFNVGGLVGQNNAQISNIGVTGSVSGASNVGGIAGRNGEKGKIAYSSAMITITETTISFPIGVHGGLAGQNEGQINNCHSRGNVSDITGRAGGLAGVNSRTGLISQSFSTSKVSGLFNIGGLTGYNSGSIAGSFATGRVTGSSSTGGLVGFNTDNGSIIASYSQSDVSGSSSVGGLVGANRAHISETYATGVVTGTEHIGGLVGANHHHIEISYWDSESSLQISGVGQGSTDGVSGLHTSEMTGNSAIENMVGFNWTVNWVVDAGYPKLIWESVESRKSGMVLK